MDAPPTTVAQAVEKKDRRLPTLPNWAAFDSLPIDKENAPTLEPQRIKRPNERNFAIVRFLCWSFVDSPAGVGECSDLAWCWGVTDHNNTTTSDDTSSGGELGILIIWDDGFRTPLPPQIPRPRSMSRLLYRRLFPYTPRGETIGSQDTSARYQTVFSDEAVSPSWLNSWNLKEGTSSLRTGSGTGKNQPRLGGMLKSYIGVSIKAIPIKACKKMSIIAPGMRMRPTLHTASMRQFYAHTQPSGHHHIRKIGALASWNYPTPNWASPSLIVVAHDPWAKSI